MQKPFILGAMALAVRAKAAKGAEPRNCDQSGCTRLTTAVEQTTWWGELGYLWISITQKWIPSGKFSMEKHHCKKGRINSINGDFQELC